MYQGKREMWRILVITLLAGPVVLAQHSRSSATGGVPLPVEEVVKKIQEKNQQRAEALQQFEGTRVYRMEYHGFPSDRQAEMTVRMNYHFPNKKEFTVISQSGSKFILNHVFRKLLEGEQEAADPENQRRTALSAENYDFQMQAYENSPSGWQYVLQVIPKIKNKFLYEGRIWVDAKDFAVTRIEAQPAKNPSFWIKKTEVEHQYTKVSDFWLPSVNHTESDIRLGGRAVLTIEYKEYKVIASRPINGTPSLDQDTAILRFAEMLGSGGQ